MRHKMPAPRLVHLEPAARGQLMGALDKLNDHYGRGTVVVVASAGLEEP